MSADLRLLTAADFQPYLHRAMQIRFTGDAKLTAELVEVKETQNHTNAERTPFYLVFRTAQKDRYYPQGIYTIEHPEKGDLAVFLVPLGPDGNGMNYEVVFS